MYGIIYRTWYTLMTPRPCQAIRVLCTASMPQRPRNPPGHVIGSLRECVYLGAATLHIQQNMLLPLSLALGESAGDPQARGGGSVLNQDYKWCFAPIPLPRAAVSVMNSKYGTGSSLLSFANISFIFASMQSYMPLSRRCLDVY